MHLEAFGGSHSLWLLSRSSVWLLTSPPPRELDGTYARTTTRGVAAALASKAAQDHQDPMSVHMNSAAIIFCNANLDFTATHMRTLGTQSAVALPVLVLALLTPMIVELLSRAHSTRGVSLRDASHEALFLFTKKNRNINISRTKRE
jgi:hypothetical protein